MTEETLQAAIMKLQSMAIEQYAIIKDLYHRPVDKHTVDKIAQHALNLANAEGAVLTLKQYAARLGKQTEQEEISNTPEQPVNDEQVVTEVEVEVEEESKSIGHDELMKRSKNYRDSVKGTKNES